MPESEDNMESASNDKTMNPESAAAEPEKKAPESPLRLSKTDLIKKVTALYTKHKEDRHWLFLTVQELNAEGILTLRGKKWSSQTLRVFINKSHIGLNPPPREESSAKKPASGRKRKEEKVAKTAQEEPLRGQRMHEATPEPSPEPQKTLLLDDHYPKFRKDLKRVQKPFRLSAELFKRAQEQQSGDVPRSGESIRELIELLLWHYLNRPEEFLWMHRGKKW